MYISIIACPSFDKKRPETVKRLGFLSLFAFSKNKNQYWTSKEHNTREHFLRARIPVFISMEAQKEKLQLRSPSKTKTRPFRRPTGTLFIEHH